MPDNAKSSSTDPCASTDEAVSLQSEERRSVRSIDAASHVQPTRAQGVCVVDVAPPRQHRRHTESPPNKEKDDPVDLLLQLMESVKTPDQPSTQMKTVVATSSGAERPAAMKWRDAARAQLQTGTRVCYRLPSCETLNDVACAIYENADVAELIYHLNESAFETQFSVKLMLRLRLMPGTLLELPSAWESAQFLARSPGRRHTFEHDIY
jgi:hypothetical protein